MAQKKRRAPRRTATRTKAHLSLVPAAAEPPTTTDATLQPPTELLDLPQDGLELGAALVENLLTALQEVRHRLDAELVITSIFQMLNSGLPDEAEEEERAAAANALVLNICAGCLEHRDAASLGVLRLLHRQGPALARRVAGEAADQLVGLGLQPPRWATPPDLRIVRTWSYGNVNGSQTSFGVQFSYAHRLHTLMVLIDHLLGGGIKDAWFDLDSSNQRAYERLREMIDGDPKAYFRDVTEAEALTGLRDALAQPPCPEQSDQIEDVDSYLYLTQTRVQQMADLLGEPEVELWSDHAPVPQPRTGRGSTPPRLCAPVPATTDPGEVDEDLVSHLLGRGDELKSDLIEFAGQPRFRRALAAAVADWTGPDLKDPIAAVEFYERFTLEHRLSDGATLAERFVADHPELDEQDRDLLLGWVDPVEEIVEVEARDGAAILARSLISDLPYRIYAVAGTAAFEDSEPGSFLVAKLVPVANAWMITGLSAEHPPQEAEEVLGLAADVALDHPATVFRNPRLLERGWEIQRADRDAFVEFFGTDLVVLPGPQCRQRLVEFRSGPTGQRPGGDLGVPDTQDTVAMLYDTIEGLGFFVEFDRFMAGFAEPDTVDRQEHQELVLSYLEDETVGAAPFQQMARAYPEATDAVLAQILDQPDFTWADDADTVLHEFKPWLTDHPLPRSIPLIARVAEHVKAYGAG